MKKAMREIRPRNVDVRRLTLTAEEGFVLSRLTGPMALRDLVAVSSLAEARVVEIVRRLAAEGAVDIVVDEGQFRDPAPSFLGIDELEGLDGDGATVEIGAATHTGLVRAENEDAFVAIALSSGDELNQSRAPVDPHGILLAVADGMGGEKAGEVASKIVVETLRDSLVGRDVGADPADALRAAVEHASARVARAAALPGREGMGATIIAVLICEGAAYTAEVGDSRCYLLRSGSLVQISKDQTHTAALVERGLMTPAEARSSRARHIVLQACGSSPEIVVAQRRVSLCDGDVLLLCSDGLNGEVEDADVAAIIVGSGQVHEACAELVTRALQNGGKDNVTVLLARLSGMASSSESTPIAVTTLRAFNAGG